MHPGKSTSTGGTGLRLSRIRTGIACSENTGRFPCDKLRPRSSLPIDDGWRPKVRRQPVDWNAIAETWESDKHCSLRVKKPTNCCVRGTRLKQHRASSACLLNGVASLCDSEFA